MKANPLHLLSSLRQGNVQAMTEEVNSPETAWPVGSWHKEPRSPTHPHAQQSKTHLPVSSSRSLPTATTGLKPELSLAAWYFLSVLKSICHLFVYHTAGQRGTCHSAAWRACLPKQEQKRFFFSRHTTKCRNPSPPMALLVPSTAPAPLQPPAAPLELQQKQKRAQDRVF